MALVDSYFWSYWQDVPFDQFAQDRDAVQRTVVHVRLKSPLLSLGIYCARPRDRALRAAAAGKLLVLRYFLRRLSRGGRVHRCGGAARSRSLAWRVSRFWTKVAHSDRRNANPGQSFRCELRRTRRAV